ncbi:MAG: HAD family hydrolase [Halobacteria archaeon]
MAGYDAVIFDNDGVLIDIEVSDPSIFVDVVREAFEEFGVEPQESEIAEFVGYAHLDPGKMRSICDRYGVEFEEVWRQREIKSSRIQRREVENGRSLYDDVEVVPELDVPVGVVSNNQRKTVEHVLSHFELDRHVDSLYAREPTVDAIEKGKPNTFYLERCIEDLCAETELCAETDLSGEDVIFVGDTETDVMAGNRLGLDSAYIDRPHTARIDEEPDVYLDSLYDLPEMV